MKGFVCRLCIMVSLAFLFLSCEPPKVEKGSKSAKVTFTITIEIDEGVKNLDNEAATFDDIGFVKIISGKGDYNEDNPVRNIVDFSKEIDLGKSFKLESKTDVATGTVTVAKMKTGKRWVHFAVYQKGNPNKTISMQEKGENVNIKGSKIKIEQILDGVYGNLGVEFE